MISLFPDSSEEPFDAVDGVESEDRTPHRPRPWVMTNMIASADGATAIDGLSGGLGRPADREMFAALRSISDAIVVGSATARQEGYRPPSTGPERAREARAQRGQRPRPLVVLVTASLSIGADEPLFSDPGYRPLIATVAASPTSRRRPLAEVADIVECGEERVELGLLLEELGRREISTVLAEGGPSLNAQLVADDLVDEWNLTLSPILAAGDAKRPAQGPALARPGVTMALRRVWLADELLFCRWVRTGPPDRRH